VATTSGREDLALVPGAVENRLRKEPFSFEFFQAVRLLERVCPGRVPVGRFAHPRTEVVRFSVNPSLSFPASEIQSLALREDGPALMTVNFIGLTGPLGVLPLYYTELVYARVIARDTVLRDFLDLFHHRIISLFYRAWEKYRLPVNYGRQELDRFTPHLLCLIGLGTEGLRNRQAVADDSLVFYAGMLAQQPRSSAGLRLLLSDYFDVPVDIEQFVGAWHRLSRDMQCCLDDSNRDSQQVAFGAVVGDEVWEPQARARIVIGPLSLTRYLDFLPNGAAYTRLRALTRFFSGDELDFDVQLILERQDVPRCELGREGANAPQLGWLSWMKSRPMDRNPAETILQL